MYVRLACVISGWHAELSKNKLMSRILLPFFGQFCSKQFHLPVSLHELIRKTLTTHKWCLRVIHSDYKNDYDIWLRKTEK